MSYVVKCFSCSKQFFVYPKRYYSRNNFFCSRKCEGEYKRNQCTTKIVAECVVCKKIFKLKKSCFNKRNKNKEITCSVKCMGILRKTKYMGRSNPNMKYNLDDNFFKNIDTEEKAYILGWIASDGSINKSGRITISIHNKDIKILEKIRNVICIEIPIVNKNIYKTNICSLSICSTTMVQDICNLLKIKPGKKHDKIKMPNLSEQLTWHFIRGFFDGDGSIKKKKNKVYISCNITTGSDIMRNNIEKFCGIYCKNNNKYKNLTWSGKNAIKFLEKLYFCATVFLERKHNIFLSWTGI